MTMFLFSTGLVALAVVLLIGWPLFRRARPAAPRAAHDAQVYRDQFAELERDLARGAISGEDAEAARIEVSRRLLAADARARREQTPGDAPRGWSRALGALTFLGLPAAAAALYWTLGAPGAPDMPLSVIRPSQVVAESRSPAPPTPEISAERAREIDELSGKAEAGDRAALYQLAIARMAVGLPREAWRDYRALIDSSDASPPAAIWSAMGEAMVIAVGGYVSPEAEEAFGQALARNPREPVALYYSGHAAEMFGDLEAAFDIWRALLVDSGADAPWRPVVEARLARLAPMLGRAASPPSGPSEEDMRAAGEMSAEDRAEMISGMVSRLRERLEREGGSAEDWARLIRALSVVGDVEGARRALTEAETALAGDAAGLSLVRAEAEAAEASR